MENLRVPDVSVVIPVWNEAGNIGPLVDRQRQVLDDLGLSAEWVVIDAGSEDATVDEARAQADSCAGKAPDGSPTSRASWAPR